LDHPNIVNVIELYIQTDDFFMIEEFYNGGSLQDRLNLYGVFDEQ